VIQSTFTTPRIQATGIEGTRDEVIPDDLSLDDLTSSLRVALTPHHELRSASEGDIVLESVASRAPQSGNRRDGLSRSASSPTRIRPTRRSKPSTSTPQKRGGPPAATRKIAPSHHEDRTKQSALAQRGIAPPPLSSPSSPTRRDDQSSAEASKRRIAAYRRRRGRSPGSRSRTPPRDNRSSQAHPASSNFRQREGRVRQGPEAPQGLTPRRSPPEAGVRHSPPQEAKGSPPRRRSQIQHEGRVPEGPRETLSRVYPDSKPKGGQHPHKKPPPMP